MLRPFLRILIPAVSALALQAQPSTNPPPVLGQFSVDFAAVDFVWDAGRERCYLLDATGPRVVAVRLSDGVPEAQFTLSRAPERGALRPDGQRLYVSMPHRPHDDYWWEPHTGTLAEIDLGTGVVREFDVDIDPFDLVATDQGWVVVSDGSGQGTHMASFNAATGARVNDVFIRQRCNLALHPSQTQVYSADTDVGPSDIRSWTLNPATGELGGGADSPYHGEYPFQGNVVVDPSGEFLIVRGGAVYSSSADPGLDMRFVTYLERGSVERVAFDVARGATFTYGYTQPNSMEGPCLTYYGPTFDAAVSWEGAEIMARDLFCHEDRLYQARLPVNEPRTEFLVRANPAVGAETNQPPTAAFTWLPENPTTLAAVRLDASVSQDDQPLSVPLRYRWDTNGDGVFEGSFGTNATVEVFFNISGEHSITLEVLDAWGVRSRITRTVTVALADDPGEIPAPHPAFQLPMRVTSAAFDFERGRVYGLDQTHWRLLSVDLATGVTIRQFQFQYEPERVVMTADARWLYVTLVVPPRGLGGAGRGFIAEFDLARGVKTREFAVDVDPWYLAATAGQVVVVSGASGWEGQVRSYDARTGERLGSAPGMLGGALAVDPGGHFALSCSSTSPEVRHFELAPDTGLLTYRPEQSFTVSYPLTPTMALDATGTRLALADGTLFEIQQPDGKVLGVIRRFSELSAMYSVSFDPEPRQALFGVQGGLLDCWNHESGSRVTETAVAPGVWAFGVDRDWLYVLDASASRTVIERLPNPMAGAETNQTPVAQFAISPAAPTTRDSVQLDASGSTDDQVGSLRYRWDWDGDGQYDTDWRTESVIAHRFWTTGEQTVGLTVCDAFGKLSQTQRTFTVTAEADPADPGGAHTPFRLPFAAADVAFDSARTNLFATDPEGKAVVRVDLKTGRIAQRWALDYPPENLTIRPDGRRLYATVLKYPHDYGLDRGEAYLAEFDLEAGGLTRWIRIDLDPWGVAATDDGWLLVSGGSAQWTSMDLYRAETGERTDRVPQIYMGLELQVGPVQDYVYAADRGLSPSKMGRIRLDRTSGKVLGIDPFPYHGEHVVEGKVFPLPDGTRVLAKSRSVFDATTMAYLQDVPIDYYIEDVAVLPDQQTLALACGDRLFYVRADTLEQLATVPIAEGAQYVGIAGTNHYVVGVSQPGIVPPTTVIQRRRFPSTGLAENRPPTLRITAPREGIVAADPAEMVFQLETQDEDGTVTNVTVAAGETVLGTATSYPFQVYCNYLPAGAYAVTAVASDNLGATSRVATVNFRITQRPTVSWSSYVQMPLLLKAPATVTLEVTAEDPDGAVSRVEFFAGTESETNLLGVVDSAPWALAVSNLTDALWFRAVAYDDLRVASAPAFLAVHFLGPPGDDFYDPFLLQGTNVTTRAANVDATIQLQERPIGGQSPSHSLWWQWTAPQNGAVVVDTDQSTFDTLLAVFTGTDPGQASLVAANDDAGGLLPFSRVKWNAVAGTTYRITVDGYDGQTGEVALRLQYSALTPLAPVNDNFTNRIVLSGTNWVVQTSNAGATFEGRELNFTNTVGGASIWWEWRPPGDGLVTLSTRGSTFDTIVTVYRVSGPPAITSLLIVAGNDDDPAGGLTSRVAFGAVAGQTYYLRVDGWKGVTGDVEFSGLWEPLGMGLRPANDDFANRTLLEGDAAMDESTIQGATVEPGEPGNLASTLWWRWTAPQTGPVYVTATATFPMLLAVYTGESLDTLSIPPSAATDSRKWVAIRFQALAGQTYAIRAGSSALRTGIVRIGVQAEVEGSPGWLAPSVLDTGEALLLRYEGEAAHTAVLEWSSDLFEWEPVSTNSLLPGAVFALPKSDVPSEYYRLRLID